MSVAEVLHGDLCSSISLRLLLSLLFLLEIVGLGGLLCMLVELVELLWLAKHELPGAFHLLS